MRCPVFSFQNLTLAALIAGLFWEWCFYPSPAFDTVTDLVYDAVGGFVATLYYMNNFMGVSSNAFFVRNGRY